LATWQDVVDCDYCAWDGERIVVDTARMTVEQCVSAILAEVLDRNRPAPATGCAPEYNDVIARAAESEVRK
jgi:hypothetical protein